MEAYKEHFPKRNRIVSGISDLVLVIEAEYRSGTSITANYAVEQKKIVCCLPSNIDSKCSMGTNRLIQQGAKLIIKPNEIIKILENKENSIYKKYNMDNRTQTKFSKVDETEKTKKIHVTQEINKEKIKQEKIKLEIPKEYEEIYKVIKDVPTHINDICKISKKNIKEVTIALTMLELEGYIEHIKGNCFKIKEKQCT